MVPEAVNQRFPEATGHPPLEIVKQIRKKK
jgi:hypothetical protein